MKLSGIVDVIIPHTIKKVMDGDGVLVAQQKNFSKSGFTTTGQKVDNVAKSTAQYVKYPLMEYDILLSKYGEPFEVAIVGKLHKYVVAREGMFILRVKETNNLKETAIALYMYLKSNKGQLELSKLALESVAGRLLNKKNLIELDMSSLDKNITQANENFYTEQELHSEIYEISRKIDELHKLFDEKNKTEDFGICKMCKKEPVTHLRTDTWQPFKRGIPMCDKCSMEIMF